MGSILRRLLARLGFGPRRLPAREPPPPRFHPGARVRRVHDGVPGVLSGTLLLDGHPTARVVFVGHRTTWVDLVRLEHLEPG